MRAINKNLVVFNLILTGALSGCKGGGKGIANSSKLVDTTPAKVPLAIASIFPPSGDVDGGLFVTISGEGFIPGVTVDIGGYPCLQVTYISMTRISCKTAAHIEGRVAVVVKIPKEEAVNGNFEKTLALGFVYTATLAGNVSNAVTAGGGKISTGTGIMMKGAVGEPGSAKAAGPPNSGIQLRTGSQGIHYEASH